MSNRIVANKHHAVDVSLRDWKHQLSNLARGQRIRRDAAGWGVHGTTRFQRLVKCRRSFRLDRDDPGFPAIPRRNSTNEAAATDSNENGREIRSLHLEL